MPALLIPPASTRRPELVSIRQPNAVFHQHTGRASVPRCGGAGGLSGRVLPAASRMVMRQATPAVSSQQALQTAQLPDRCLITTSVTAETFNEALLEIAEACSSGADLVELRIDCIQDLDVKQHLPALLDACTVPAIVTYRPQWEDPSSTYVGPEDERIQALQYAASLGPAFVDCEYEASAAFLTGKEQFAPGTRIILSKHDFEKTLPMEALQELAASMWAAGADVVKIAMMAQDVSDCLPMFNLLKEKKGPTVSLSMSEKGQPVRLLAPKFGGFLTFAAMSPERASAPGQPTVQDMQELYRVPSMSASTKVYGIVGNPVSHSRSPLIHNRAMACRDVDGVYIPLLVDDMPSFLQAFSDADFQGFSVTIPHKEAAYQAAASMDEVAKQIGAVNTLIRQEDGSLKGYNTDWSAAISAIERGLPSGSSAADAASPLQGKTVVVVGAGGAGRALAFGAAFKGAKVVVTNRNRARAEELANEVPGGAEVADLAAVQAGDVTGQVLVNTTSLGMHPKEEETPVPEVALGSYELVFDAIYTPMETRLLREAKASGCVAVSGFEMFVGQAADQFRYFTGKEPPVELMSDVVLASLQK